jgi:hypothetical protein
MPVWRANSLLALVTSGIRREFTCAQMLLSFQSVCFGFSRFALVSVGLLWFQSVCFGFSRFALVSVGLFWFQSVFALVSVGLLWFQSICSWFQSVCFGFSRFALVSVGLLLVSVGLLWFQSVCSCAVGLFFSIEFCFHFASFSFCSPCQPAGGQVHLVHAATSKSNHFF